MTSGFGLPAPGTRADAQLIRGIGLWQATALNMIDMIGVGPFITIPLIIAAMHGPQAMLGWVLGAAGGVRRLVWAELGATFPEAGGPVRYLREMYGPRFGKLLSFLFVWQLTFSAPLSIASGCIGLAQYAGYLWPALRTVLAAHQLHLSIPRASARRCSTSRSRGHVPGDGHGGVCRVPALPPHHDHREAGVVPLGGRHRLGALDHRVRPASFQRARRRSRFRRARGRSIRTSFWGWAPRC